MKKILFMMAIAIMVVCTSTSCDTFKSEETPISDGLVMFTAKGDNGKILKGIKTKGGVYRGMKVADGAVILEAKCENIEYDSIYAWGTEPSGDVWAVSVKDRKVIGPFRYFHLYSKGFYEGEYGDGRKYYYVPATGVKIETPKNYLYDQGSTHFVYNDPTDTTLWVIATSKGIIQKVNSPVAIIYSAKNSKDVYAFIVKEKGHYVGYHPSYNVGKESLKELDFSSREWENYKGVRTELVSVVHGCEIRNLNYMRK